MFIVVLCNSKNRGEPTTYLSLSNTPARKAEFAFRKDIPITARRFGFAVKKVMPLRFPPPRFYLAEAGAGSATKRLVTSLF